MFIIHKYPIFVWWQNFILWIKVGSWFFELSLSLCPLICESKKLNQSVKRHFIRQIKKGKQKKSRTKEFCTHLPIREKDLHAIQKWSKIDPHPYHYFSCAINTKRLCSWRVAPSLSGYGGVLIVFPANKWSHF